MLKILILELPDSGASDEYHREGMTGGMCVRAVQDSGVDVNLVNFVFKALRLLYPGSIITLKGTGCERFEDTAPNEGPIEESTSFDVTPAGTALESPVPRTRRQ